jgi:hypothetical protein
MSQEPEILYTAEATVTGGREGHGRTSDGRLDVDLDVPSEMGGTGRCITRATSWATAGNTSAEEAPRATRVATRRNAACSSAS